ncbi:MAG: type IV toxin-antitoxin system AbiEi family antitoxin domain-containing protein [Kineosporiaceae bacterium]
METARLAELSDLASGQWGLLTAAQAHTIGVSRVRLARLVDSGILERVAHGVYAFPAVIGDELLGLRAAWIALQPTLDITSRLRDPIAAGVVSHASAARLHDLGDLLADEHEFTLPTRYQARRAGTRAHRGSLSPAEVTLVAGLPVTTAARTVADLLSAGHDIEHVGQVAADAVRQGSADVRVLARALQPLASRHRARAGSELAVKLLTAGGAPESALAVPEKTGSELEVAIRTLAARPGTRPDAVVVAELLTLVILSASANPSVRAAVTTLAANTQTALAPIGEGIRQAAAPAVAAARKALAAAMPTPETRARIMSWLEDPTTQAAFQELLRSLQALQSASTAQPAIDDRDEAGGEDEP